MGKRRIDMIGAFNGSGFSFIEILLHPKEDKV